MEHLGALEILYGQLDPRRPLTQRPTAGTTSPTIPVANDPIRTRPRSPPASAASVASIRSSSLPAEHSPSRCGSIGGWQLSSRSRSRGRSGPISTGVRRRGRRGPSSGARTWCCGRSTRIATPSRCTRSRIRRQRIRACGLISRTARTATRAIFGTRSGASRHPRIRCSSRCCRCSDQPAGVASYLRMTPEHGVIEIGHIWFGASLRQTTAATEAIYLLAAHAFDDLGYRRLEWKCDSLNAGFAPGRRALRVSLRGRVPPSHGGQGAQPRYRLVRDHRRRVAGGARRLPRRGSTRQIWTRAGASATASAS